MGLKVKVEENRYKVARKLQEEPLTKAFYILSELDMGLIFEVLCPVRYAERFHTFYNWYRVKTHPMFYAKGLAADLRPATFIVSGKTEERVVLCLRYFAWYIQDHKSDYSSWHLW